MLRRALDLDQNPHDSFFLWGPRQTGKTSLVRAAYPDAAPLLRAYVNDYLKEEIAAEGIVRNLPVFASFLTAAARADAEPVSSATIARDCGVSAPTVRSYFEILVDTLLGRFLPAYTRRPKRRVVQTPKCYFADVAVAGTLAKRGRLEPGSPLFGKALENWVCHELHAYFAYRELDHGRSYWRLAGGTEVDFVIGAALCAIEVTATSLPMPTI